MRSRKIRITNHAILRYRQRISDTMDVEVIKMQIKEELCSSETRWILMNKLPKEIFPHLSLRGRPGGLIAFNLKSGVLFKIHFEKKDNKYIVASVDKIDGVLRDALEDLILKRGKQFVL